MKVYKKVLIVALMLAFVASTGAAIVSAQTSDTVTALTVDNASNSALATGDNSAVASAPTVGATYKTPTTFVAWAEKQSVQKSYYFDPVPAGSFRYQTYYNGCLRAGATGLTGQKVNVYYYTSDTGEWKMWTTTTNLAGGQFAFKHVTSYAGAHTQQYYFVFPGTGTYAAAKSNIVTVKCEPTKTTPYLTTLFGYAKKQVVPHGTTNTMFVKLMHGITPLTGQYVYVWKWSGGKFVIVSRIITRTASQAPGAGWAQADYRWNPVGTGMYKFTYFGTSPSGTTSYARSESNAVQLIWT